MTLAEIVDACQRAFGARFQFSTAKILQYINTVQQVAFNRDLQAFLWVQDYLTVYQELTFSAIGTPFAAGDVGKTVVATGGTGILRSYDAVRLTAQVETSDTLSGALTVTSGTGAATIASQAVSKGPYSWASVSPSFGSLTPYTQPAGFRRVLGVTRLSEQDIFGTVPPRPMTDYGFSTMQSPDRFMLENVRRYEMQRCLAFVDEPDTTANAYRWLGYIRPPLINAATAADDANLLIGPEFHETVVKEGVLRLCDRSTYGDMAPEQVLEQILTPFWNAMQEPYLAMGYNANMTSEGSL